MEREYPQKMFWLFVLTNFLFHFFYLSVPLHRWDLDKDLSLHWMCGSWPGSDPFDC